MIVDIAARNMRKYYLQSVSCQDVVLFGYRDAEQSSIYGSQDIRNSNINVFDLSDVKK